MQDFFLFTIGCDSEKIGLVFVENAFLGMEMDIYVD